MNKEASLKQKMKAQDQGERNTSKFELLQARSSNELLRRFKIKREKIMRGTGVTNEDMVGTKEPIGKQNNPSSNKISFKATVLDKQTQGVKHPSIKIAPQAQFKLSNFAAIDQINISKENDTN